MSRWRRSRYAGAGLAAMLLASACVQPGRPGVGVQKVAADIVFGVKPGVPFPPNLAPGQVGSGDATTYLPVPASAAAGAGAEAADEADYDSGPGGTGRRLRPVTPLNPARTPCPPAALTAFPAREAGLKIEGLPAVGQYRWKRTGTQTLANLPGVKLPVAGFEQRLVRNVVKVSDSEYTFETVQPELGSDVTTISTFKVRTGAVSQTVTPPVEADPNHPPVSVPLPAQVPGTRPAAPKAPVPETLSVGDPERGISLVRLQRVDAAGNSSELTFSPGVLYLPLAIVPGEEWDAVGVDPRTGSVLEQRAKVVKRERVDACGDVVDGWAVEATQTFSGPGQAGTAPARSYRYIVAPQLGGIIISEAIHTATAQGTTDVTLSLGQLQPSPLPAPPPQQGAAK